MAFCKQFAQRMQSAIVTQRRYALQMKYEMKMSEVMCICIGLIFTQKVDYHNYYVCIVHFSKQF